MDLLSLVLQMIAIAPLLLRSLRQTSPRAPAGAAIGGELAATFRTPGLFGHIAGLLLIFVGFDIALVAGEVDRAVTWRGVVGCGLLALAAIVMIAAFRTLRSWRLLPRIEGSHELCVAGPYRLVRHPIYLGFDLMGLGVAFCAPTAAVIIGMLLIIVSGELRARAEERALVAAFGPRYEDYQRRVARRLPGVY
jgi:protein-S-isoprenylcysteine O-methyltransferase Ste14